MARLTGDQLFWLTHVGLAVWAAIVLSIAVIMEDPGYVFVFFIPAVLIRWA